MLVRFPFTLVQATPTGFFVANGGETHDLPEAFALSLVETGEAEAVDVAIGDLKDPLDAIVAPIITEDGAPLDPPAGDIEAGIAAPAVIAEAPKSKRGKAPAADDPLDAPVS